MGALTQVQAFTEVRSNAAQPGRRAWWLAGYRPDIVIAAAEGPDALLAALYRLLSPRSRLLVQVHSRSEQDGMLGGLRRAIVLNQADAVLAEDSGVGLPSRRTKAGRRRARVFPLRGPAGLEAFLGCDLARLPSGRRRIAFAGPLSPHSGATDILLSVAAWVAQHGKAEDPVEIWWLGDGDLVGILDAQPLPRGMSQRFVGPQDRAGLAECFAQCGILVLPMESEAPEAANEHVVAEALAAGLVVVGSQRNAQVSRYVVDGVTGWTFDPRRSGQLGQAIGRALGAADDDVAAMRAKARERIRRLVAETDAERLHAALLAVLPSPAAALHRPGLTALHQQGIGPQLPDSR